MTTAGRSGFEARTRDPERRAFFDLQKRIAALEAGGGGGPGGAGDEVWIGPDDPAGAYELWVDTDAIASVPWINATLQNGWQNYGGSWQTMQYRKVSDMVQLRGFIKGGTIGSNPVFTLPAGYRPPLHIYATCISTGPGFLLTAIQINSAGTVHPEWGGNTWFAILTQFSVTA